MASYPTLRHETAAKRAGLPKHPYTTGNCYGRSAAQAFNQGAKDGYAKALADLENRGIITVTEDGTVERAS